MLRALRGSVMSEGRKQAHLPRICANISLLSAIATPIPLARTRLGPRAPTRSCGDAEVLRCAVSRFHRDAGAADIGFSDEFARTQRHSVERM